MATVGFYLVTIKAKDVSLRQAAADFISLVRGGERVDKKESTAIKKKTSWSPRDACIPAAKFFPGVTLGCTHSSGREEKEEFHCADGAPPNAPMEVAANRAMEMLSQRFAVPGIVDLETKLSWFTPLAEYAAEKNLPQEIQDRISATIKAMKDAARANEQATQDRLLAGTKTLLKKVVWSFDPSDSLPAQKIGELGEYFLREKGPQYTENTKELLARGFKLFGLNGTVQPALRLKAASSAVETELRQNPAARSGLDEEFFVRGNIGSKPIYDKSIAGIGYDSEHGLSIALDRESEKSDQSRAASRGQIKASLFSAGDALWVREGLGKSPQHESGEIGSFLVHGNHVFVVLHYSSSSPTPPSLLRLSAETGLKEWCKAFSNLRRIGQLCAAGNDQLCLAAVDATTQSEKIIAVSMADGSVTWSYSLPEERERCRGICTPPGIIVVATSIPKSGVSESALPSDAEAWSHGVLYGLDAATGKTLWASGVGPRQELGFSSLVSDGRCAFYADDSAVHAFTLEGDRMWQSNAILGEKDRYDPRRRDDDYLGLTLTGSGVILMTVPGEGIRALRAQDGQELWRHTETQIRSSCSIGTNGVAYFFSATKLVALDSVTGNLLYETELPDGSWASGMGAPTCASNGMVLFPMSSYPHRGDRSVVSIYAMDAKNGTVAWSLPLRVERARHCLSPSGDLFLIGGYDAFFGSCTSQIFRVDAQCGTPAGSWPMENHDCSSTSCLPLNPRGGFKRFVANFREGNIDRAQLARLAPALTDEANLPSHVHGIIRGHQLLKNAREWAEPTIGMGDTAKYRGLQWRLVMAYGGMELILRSLLPKSASGGLGRREIEPLLERLRLPACPRLESPSLDRASLNEWLIEQDEDAVLDFLQMEKGDRACFNLWLFERKPVGTWPEAVLLAKALRNATAHGALSPSKVESWGLAPAITVLADALFQIDSAVFAVLGE